MKARTNKKYHTLSKDNVDPKLLKKMIKFCERDLESTKFHVVKFNSSDSVTCYPQPKKGNSTYNLAMAERYTEIFTCFGALHRSEKKPGNISTTDFFITLTRKYDYGHPTDSWIEIKSAFKTFIDSFKKRLKKQGLKVQHYMVTYESHLKGGAHIHMLIHLDQLIGVHYEKQQSNNYNSVKEILVEDDPIIEPAVNDLWGGFVDVQGVSSVDGVCDYLGKEFAKSGSVANSLYFVKKGEVRNDQGVIVTDSQGKELFHYTDIDVQRIATHYFECLAARKIKRLEKRSREQEEDLLGDVSKQYRSIQTSLGLRYDKVFPLVRSEYGKGNKCIDIVCAMCDPKCRSAEILARVNDSCHEILARLFDFERIEFELSNSLVNVNSNNYGFEEEVVEKLKGEFDIKNPLVLALLKGDKGKINIFTKNFRYNIFSESEDVITTSSDKKDQEKKIRSFHVMVSSGLIRHIKKQYYGESYYVGKGFTADKKNYIVRYLKALVVNKWLRHYYDSEIFSERENIYFMREVARTFESNDTNNVGLLLKNKMSITYRDLAAITKNGVISEEGLKKGEELFSYAFEVFSRTGTTDES